MLFGNLDDMQANRPEWIDKTTWTRACAVVVPPIAGKSDAEYSTRLDAERVTIEWRAKIRASGKQYGVEDLPLFNAEGGQRRLF